MASQPKYSARASICPDGARLWVFGQRGDGTLIQWQHIGVGVSWSQAIDMGYRAEPGTSMTAAWWIYNEQLHARVYFHAEDGLRELCNDDLGGRGNWFIGDYFVSTK